MSVPIRGDGSGRSVVGPSSVVLEPSLDEPSDVERSASLLSSVDVSSGPGLESDPLVADPPVVNVIETSPFRESACPGNTKGGSITVPLTSCLTGLD